MIGTIFSTLYILCINITVVVFVITTNFIIPNEMFTLIGLDF